MKQIVIISEEGHGIIGAASNFEKAKQFLLENGWVDELWCGYMGAPLIEIFGENWQENFLELSKDDFDETFYFSEKDFMD